MFIVRLEDFRIHQNDIYESLVAACIHEPALDEDYVRTYGESKSAFLLELGELFRLTPRNEADRETIRCMLLSNILLVASCEYCRTRDWTKHDQFCPINTPTDSAERNANLEGDKDGRQGEELKEPNNPYYMLGYDWGLSCKHFFDGGGAYG